MKVGVIFGGRSCEHDISVITGVMTANAAKINNEVVPIYIDGDGVFYSDRTFFATTVFEKFDEKKYTKKRVHFRPSSNKLFYENGKVAAILDVVILCNHGMNGEDGTISALMELAGIPYVGSGVLPSAVGMDKITQKVLFKEADLAVTRYVSLSKSDLDDKFFDLAEAVASLNFPVIIKPSNLGSSIGISHAHDFKELFIRLETAFLWDNRVLVEEALTDFTEVNCAVLGLGKNVLVSAIEQPLHGGFLSYEDKYEGGGKGNTGRYLPAHISVDMSERVRTAAKKVFNIIGCAGVARVDFLIKDDRIYVNEINTIPGSLSSYLFAFDGISFESMIERLIKIAFEAKKCKDRLLYTFNSGVLKNTGKKCK